MATIKFAGFSGEQPRVIPRLMPPNAAQSAINARLDDGGLTPQKADRFEQAFVGMPTGGYDTIYRHLGLWLGWTGLVHAAPGPVDQTRLYFTGDGVPKMRAETGAVYPLAVPRPTAALAATPAGTGSGNVYTRIYVYTFVTAFGEESEPCPASPEIQWQSGMTCTLNGFQEAPGGRAITLQRIYRSQTGASGTDLYLIAERASSSGDFYDDVPIDQFAEALPSRNWTAPVDDLEGLTEMPNGMMAAFSGKDLYFSEPFHPHAWPEVYSLQTNDPIVGLGAIGTSLIVMTTKHPVICSGTAPESMVMQKMEVNYPCINARSIVDLGFAIAYASTDGIVLARADGTIGIVTNNIFNRDDWQALNPVVMIGGQYRGRYIATFASYDETLGLPLEGSLIIDVAQSPSFLIRSDVVAAAWFFDVPSGSLFFRKPLTPEIFEFDPSSGTPKTLSWRSKEFVTPSDLNFGAILIDTLQPLTKAQRAAYDANRAALIAANTALIASGELFGDVNGIEVDSFPLNGDALAEVPPARPVDCTVHVFADGVLVQAVQAIDRPARLKSGYLSRRWEIEVITDMQIEQIVLAGTIDELRQVP